eukprot:11467921-Heterocapsa_arctica.AAC.1
MIGHRQLSHLGHLARKPEHSMERMALWCWLKPDHSLNAVRQRLPLRRHFWQRLDELRMANHFSKYNFENAWINLATQDEGRVWLKLIKNWTSYRKKYGDAYLWENKHA